MTMTNDLAAMILRFYPHWATMGKEPGKRELALTWSQAVSRATAALKKAEPRPAIESGRVFRRRYCPACHERVKRPRGFCPACGQAYRGAIFRPSPPDYHIPAPPPRGYGYKAGIMIFDEIDGKR